MPEPKYFAVGERETLFAMDIDEAVNECLDEMWTDASPGDLPETFRVQGYAPRQIDTEDRIFTYMIEDLVERLDEEYGHEDKAGEYDLSTEAQKLLEAFKAQVIAEYPVYQCEMVGEAVEVDLAPYIAKVLEDM